MLGYNKQKKLSCITCNKITDYIDKFLECQDCVSKFYNKMMPKKTFLRRPIKKEKIKKLKEIRQIDTLSLETKEKIALEVYKNYFNYRYTKEMKQFIIDKFNLDPNLNNYEFRELSDNKAFKKFGLKTMKRRFVTLKVK